MIAIEPRSYREAIARVMGELRPSHEVTVAEPAELGRQIERLEPELAICAVPNRFSPGERPARWSSPPTGSRRPGCALAGGRARSPW